MVGKSRIVEDIISKRDWNKKKKSYQKYTSTYYSQSFWSEINVILIDNLIILLFIYKYLHFTAIPFIHINTK